jgi:hypothetical protein
MPTGTKIGTLMSISTTLATLSQQVKLLCEHIEAEAAAAAAKADTKPPASDADPAPAPRRGRPPKQETIPEVEAQVEEEKPKDDKAITPDHPLRAKLQEVAKAACAVLDRAKVVATIALFAEGGQGSASVPDAQLGECIKAIQTKVENAKKKAEKAEEPL